MKIAAWFILAAATAFQTCLALDWSQFRGPNGASAFPLAEPPIEFSAADMTNVAWKVEMPGRSVAGAIVVGNKIISTSSSGVDNQRIFITANDLESGKKMWQQDLVCRGRPFSHPTSANAAPTPASDGKHVYAFYSSNDLVCLDLDGNLVWYRSLSSDYPKLMNDVGMSSSPIVVNDVVVVQAEAPSDAYLFGLNAMTGETMWKIDRPRAMNWTSPIAMGLDTDQPWIVATSGDGVIGVDPKSGKVLFNLDSGASTIPSAVVDGNRFYAPVDGLTAFQVGSRGTEPIKLWSSKKLGPDNGSPVVSGTKIWVVKGSVLAQGNSEDGGEDWKLRLPDAGSIWATPVLCGDRIYVFSDNGKCFVCKVGEKGELLATNELGDAVYGSPAVTEDSLIVRSDKFLWKIAKGR